ncbi:MAG: hypothetical protein ABIQ35_14050 [Verrucomicrobiota bacterium]
MSYLTLAVEIDHGKVVSKDASQLPEKASGLLTIFLPETTGISKLTPLQALDALQKHLQVDANKAAKWMAAVREGRR